MQEACRIIIEDILNGKISTRRDLEVEKRQLCRDLKLSKFMSNADILKFAKPEATQNRVNKVWDYIWPLVKNKVCDVNGKKYEEKFNVQPLDPSDFQIKNSLNPTRMALKNIYNPKRP